MAAATDLVAGVGGLLSHAADALRARLMPSLGSITAWGRALMASDDWPKPEVVLAVGAAVAAGVVALGYAVRIAVPAIGVAVGLGLATATTGLATAGSAAPWVAPVAAGGLALVGISLSIHLSVSAAEAVQQKPYEWALPILGFLGALLLNLWKDLPGTAGGSLKFLVSTAAAFLIIVAGAYYKRDGAKWKSAAVGLYLLLPMTLLAWDFRLHGITHQSQYFRDISPTAWLSVGALGVLGMLMAGLERVTR